jgi:hypothetical protein
LKRSGAGARSSATCMSPAEETASRTGDKWHLDEVFRALSSTRFRRVQVPPVLE